MDSKEALKKPLVDERVINFTFSSTLLLILNFFLVCLQAIDQLRIHLQNHLPKEPKAKLQNIADAFATFQVSIKFLLV